MEKHGNNSFDKNFNRALITLVAPIALQNLISAAVSSADVIMLGTVSQSAMSAVSLAGHGDSRRCSGDCHSAFYGTYTLYHPFAESRKHPVSLTET